MIENFVFGRSGLNSSVFEKLWISYSCILLIKLCALRSFCIKILCFSKIVLFLKNMVSLCLIRSVHYVFWLIEIFKIWERQSLSVSIDRGWFSTDRNSWISFLKKTDLDFFKVTFQIVLFFSLSALALGSTIQFLSFSFKIFARFLSLEAGKSLLPFFFKFISCFHAFFMH